MGLIVQKYGGTSVADPEKIQNVASRIVATAREGHDVVAVVSAPGDTTDELIEFAEAVSDTRPRREMDLLMATGEMVGSSLVAMAIEDLEQDAVALTGAQMGIRTDVAHTRARIRDIEASRIRSELDRGKIVVAAGFQGMTPNGDIATLGRGGSDTTAVALAAVLEADECEIYTDVDGVFTADPRIVPEARKISKLNSEEMLELASLGTNVLQVRAVEFGWKHDVKIHVRSSFHDESGTVILPGGDDTMEEVDVRAVTADMDQTRISLMDVPDRPGVAASIFGALADRNINIDMIIQSSAARQQVENDISFTVTRSDFDEALSVMEQVVEDINAEGLSYEESIAKVSVVGTGMRNHPGVAKKVFDSLGHKDINIEMISTSEIKISVVIGDDQVDEAVNLLHDVFELETEPSGG